MGRTFDFDKRFWSRIKFEPGPLETECAVWQGYCDAAGYGNYAKTSPHRWAYRRYVSEIPEDKELDHLCRNRSCANPLHLEPVIHRENMERGAYGVLKDRCKRGHAYTPENTYTYQGKFGPARQCRVCNASRQQALRDSRKAQPPAEPTAPEQGELFR